MFNPRLEKLSAETFNQPRGVAVIATHETRGKKWKVYEDGVVQRLEGKTTYQWCPPDLDKFLEFNQAFTRV